jgi:hypothetical protein
MFIEETKYRIQCDHCSNELLPWNLHDSEDEAERDLESNGWAKEGGEHICDECIADGFRINKTTLTSPE